MELPLRQLIRDLAAESQESAARILAPLVSPSRRISAEVTKDGLLLHAATELDLEVAVDILHGASRDLAVGKPQINYIQSDSWQEPFASLIVKFPTERLADVRKDLQARRAEVQECKSSEPGDTIIRALAPMAELFGYATSLSFLAAGRGSFEQKFVEYRPLPRF